MELYENGVPFDSNFRIDEIDLESYTVLKSLTDF